MINSRLSRNHTDMVFHFPGAAFLILHFQVILTATTHWTWRDVLNGVAISQFSKQTLLIWRTRVWHHVRRSMHNRFKYELVIKLDVRNSSMARKVAIEWVVNINNIAGKPRDAAVNFDT